MTSAIRSALQDSTVRLDLTPPLTRTCDREQVLVHQGTAAAGDRAIILTKGRPERYAGLGGGRVCKRLPRRWRRRETGSAGRVPVPRSLHARRPQFPARDYPAAAPS